MKDLIIVFVKNPKLGKCKTRLAKSIGDKKALEVYIELINHTAKTISKVNAVRAVFYSEDIQKQDIWEDSKFQKQVQSQGHLGQKMEAAFEWGFAQGYSKICIIGSDLFELESLDLEKAFDKLEQNDVVFGPANDGGYYLMGMSKFYKNAFLEKAWSTAIVLEKTLQDLHGLNIALLEPKTDIDTVEDLVKYPEFHHYIPTPILKQLT